MNRFVVPFGCLSISRFSFNVWTFESSDRIQPQPPNFRQVDERRMQAQHHLAPFIPSQQSNLQLSLPLAICRWFLVPLPPFLPTMSSPSLTLPAPRRSMPTAVSQRRKAAPALSDDSRSTSKGVTTSVASRRAPSYEERCRAATKVAKLPPAQRKSMKLFVPRSLKDFDDGGAFPEIHVAQYPRHMGNPHIKSSRQNTSLGAQSSSRALVNVEIDKDGEVSYDAIVKNGTNGDKLVYSKLQDVKGGDKDEDAVALPSAQEEEETRNKTAMALNALLSSKTALDKASGSAMENAKTSQDQEKKTQFIKYTPNPDAPGYNPAAAQRVIQMVPAQIDPMMPPKHKHTKAPRGPAEDPVPILHGPPPKLTKEEKDAWNVPACISNWKNTRGYTIPLDKRLAADGRGLRDTTTINPNFATLSESLYVAEKQARQEVKLRAQVQKRQALQEKEKRENELRDLANQARQQRANAAIGAPAAAGVGSGSTDPAAKKTALPLGGLSDDSDDDSDDEVSSVKVPSSKPSGGKNTVVVPADRDNIDDNGDNEDAVAAKQRDRLRQERRRQREREYRMEQSMDGKRQKLEKDRDISEKVALGQHTGTGGGGDVDSRLYNQSAGLSSGFGKDDDYNTYSKPLFESRAGVGSIYRPTRGDTEHNADEQYEQLKQDGVTKKFQPNKGFAGAEGGTGAQARSAPVQFEKGS